MNYLENADTKSDHFLAQTEKPMLPETTASYCVCVSVCVLMDVCMRVACVVRVCVRTVSTSL